MLLLDFFFDYFSSSCWHPAFNATLPAFRPLELSCCIWTGDAFAFTLVLTVVTVGPVTFAAEKHKSHSVGKKKPKVPNLKGQDQGAAVMRKAPPGGQSCCHKSYMLLGG